MKKKMHIVFPKEYLTTLVQGLSEYPQIDVTGTDYDLDGFYHHALKAGELDCSVAVVVIDIKGDIPIEKKAEEILEKLTEIRINRPHLRLILSLSKSYEHMTFLKQTLVSLSIYDLHFKDNFIIDELIEWVEKPLSLADMKEYIVSQQQTTSIDNRISKSEAHNEREAPVEPATKKTIDDERGTTRINRRLNRMTSLKTEKQPKTRVETKVVREMISVTQQNIAFLSLSKGAGSTFHSVNFSAFLSNLGANVGLYENPLHEEGRTYLTDLFNVFRSEDRHFSLPHLLREGKPFLLESSFNLGNITMYPINYDLGPITSFDNDMLSRYQNTGRHTFKVMDLGYMPLSNETKQILQGFDHVIVLIDLFPQAFIPNSERFLELKQWAEQFRQTNIDFWINPYSSYFPKHELKELDLHTATRIPYYDRESIIKATFEQTAVYTEDEQIQSSLDAIYMNYSNQFSITLPTARAKKKGLLQKIISF